MNKKIEKFREDFFARTEKYGIPSNNKIFYYWILSQEVVEDPTNEELQDLLLTFVCCSDIIISHFFHRWPKEGPMDVYKASKKNKSRLKKAIAAEARMAKEWEGIKKRKTLPTAVNLPREEMGQCEKEAEQLRSLYLEYFFCGEEECPELYGNLLAFCKVARAFPMLGRIAPFFFYQIMVKHAGRLAQVKGFQFSLKSLWDYREYQIKENNGKNFSKYKAYTKLFTALCKQYKQDERVSIQLCRYAFSHSSNLAEWAFHFRFYKFHKFQSKLMVMLYFFVQTSEIWVPDEYSENKPYYITDEEYNRYFLGCVEKGEADYSDYIWEADAAFCQYFYRMDGEEPIDLLYRFFINMDHDPQAEYEIIKEFYERAQLSKIYPDGVPMKCRLVQVYNSISNYVEDILREKVRAAVLSIVENCQV